LNQQVKSKKLSTTNDLVRCGLDKTQHQLLFCYYDAVVGQYNSSQQKILSSTFKINNSSFKINNSSLLTEAQNILNCQTVKVTSNVNVQHALKAK